MSLRLARDTPLPAVWLIIPCRARSLTHSSSNLRNHHHERRPSSKPPRSTTSFVHPKPVTKIRLLARALQSIRLASSVARTCPPQEAQARFHRPANSTRTTTASSTPRLTRSQTRSPEPSSRRKDARAVSWTVSAVLRLTQMPMLAGLPLRRRAMPAMSVLTRARSPRPRRSRSLSARRRLLSNRLRTSASLVWGRCSAGRVR